MNDVEKLPYRKGVQIYVFKDDKLLLVSSAKKQEYFKVPAGGLENEETYEQAAKREMKEELNVDIEITGKSKLTNSFLWPLELIKIEGHKYKGQEQCCFFAKILTNNMTINQDEVGAIKWISKEEIDSIFNLGIFASLFNWFLQLVSIAF